LHFTFVAENCQERSDAHLEQAILILERMGARNGVAKAARQRARGDTTSARELLDRALGRFEELGTLDEPGRVRKALAVGPARDAT
jgi:hypothetical protein